MGPNSAISAPPVACSTLEFRNLSFDSVILSFVGSTKDNKTCVGSVVFCNSLQHASGYFSGP